MKRKISEDVSKSYGSISDFKVLQWKTEKDSAATQQFFVKAHSVRESNPKKPTGRTLFIINIAPFINTWNLKQMFGTFGKINDVFLHQKPSAGIPDPLNLYFPKSKDSILGHKVGYVVFKDPKSLKDILELNTNDIDPLLLHTSIQCGLKSWVASYNSQILDTQTLETNVQEFMETFEKKELQRKEEEKNEGEPDDEGWVKVTRRGKRAAAGTVRTEKMQEKLSAKRRRFEKQLMNFTPTQLKETRAKQLTELKQKFEEDKQRVTLLKQQRKFKPF